MRRPWPSLPDFGSESPPVASTTRAAVSSSRAVRTTKPPPAALDPLHTLPRPHRYAARGGFVQQRLQHDAGPVRVREELAVLFLVQRDADLAEERDRLVDAVRLQDPPEEVRRRAAEVALPSPWRS